MDSGREREKPSRPPKETGGPRLPAMVGAQSVTRCAGCGRVLPAGFDPNGKCQRCGFELHCCKQCAHFDTSHRFECTQPIPQRIARKDARNECTYYSPRVTVERQTSGDPARQGDPRAAFESLFKK